MRVEDATDDLRAAHRQDPASTNCAELADLLGWLPRHAPHARRQAGASTSSLALVGLVLAAPLMVLTALAIRLESAGPVLYAQERVGENGRTFTLYKFRSMRHDAESDGTPVWARDDDDRVTRVGRFIRQDAARRAAAALERAARRHELRRAAARAPVLRGAARRQEIPFYRQRHAVKPGLTGWAQVKYRYGASIEDATREAAVRPLLHQAPVARLRPDDRVRHGQGDPLRQGGQVTHALPSDVLGRVRQPRCSRDRAQRRHAVRRHRGRGVIGLVMLPFNVRASGAVELRPLDADGVDHGLLLGARSRLRRRAREVHRAVPRAWRDAAAINEILEHAVRRLHRGRASSRGWRPPGSASTLRSLFHCDPARRRPAASCC